jgi:hypothetical protein
MLIHFWDTKNKRLTGKTGKYLMLKPDQNITIKQTTGRQMAHQLHT